MNNIIASMVGGVLIPGMATQNEKRQTGEDEVDVEVVIFRT